MYKFSNLLIVLSEYLRFAGFDGESIKVAELANPKVLAHIAGPSGAGKTTILENIKAKFPDVTVKDLDEIDEQAKENLKCHWDVNKWTDEQFDEHSKEKQRVLDSFINSSKGNIVLAGFHAENAGAYAMDINAEKYFRLNTSAEDSSKRAKERDKKHLEANPNIEEQSLEEMIEMANNDIIFLDGDGYEPASANEIIDWLYARLK